MNTHSWVEQAFWDLGISPKETRVYKVLLEIRQGTISDISRHVYMPRTSLYPLLESLERRGFAHQLRVKNHTEWAPADPDDVYRQAKDAVKNLGDVLLELKKITPLFGHGVKKSEIVFYKSVLGLKRAYESITKLRPGERVYSIEGNQSIKAKQKRFSKKSIAEWQFLFKKSGAILESIISEDTLDLLQKFDTEVLRAHRGRTIIVGVLPNALMDFDADIIIFRNTVIITIVSRDIAIILNSTEIAEAFRNLFFIAQQSGKKMDLNAYIEKILKKRA